MEVVLTFLLVVGGHYLKVKITCLSVGQQSSSTGCYSV